MSVGLEIGATAVRAVRLDPRSKPPRLLAAVSAPWGGSSGEELLRAIQQVRRTLPITSPVVLGLPTTAAIITTVQPLLVSRARSELAVRFELQQQLPYDVAQTAWHYRWHSLNGHAETSPSAVVAAVKHSVLQERVAVCQRAGVSIRSVQVNAVALANAWWQSVGQQASRPSVVMRLDGRLLEWLVVSDNGLYVLTSVFPAAAGVPPSAPTAHPLAPRAAEAAEASVIHAGLTQADRDQAAAFLKTSWEGLRTHMASVTSAPLAASTVWLAGVSPDQPALSEDLHRATGCTVRLISAEAVARADGGRSLHVEEVVAACGLALQGAGTAMLPLNLIERVSRAQRVARLNRAAQVTGLASVCLAVLWSSQGILASLRSHEALLARYRAQEQSYQLLRPEVRSIRKQQAQLEQRLAQLESLARTRDRVTRSVVQLTEALPDSLWLTTLDLAKAGPQVTGTLEGYAQSFQGVTQFIDRVKSAPEWVTVKPQATNVTTDPVTRTEVVAFAIHLERLVVEPPHGSLRVTEETAKTDAKKPARKKPSRAGPKQSSP